MCFRADSSVIVRLALLAFGAGLAASPALAQTPSFSLVGAPSGSNSEINALSADGSVAAGNFNFSSRGFTWTAVGGRHDFGNTAVLPLGISGDGQVVVGTSGPQREQAFRWTQAGGFSTLTALPGYGFAQAIDANQDGSIIVGTLDNGSGTTPQAFRWTQSGGMQGLGAGTRAYAISGNGNVIVANDGTAPNGFVWTQAGGRQYLQSLPGGTGAADVRATNFDGSIVVGTSGPFDAHPTMWTNGVPVEIVNALPSSAFTPRGVSDSGGVVAGVIQNQFGQLSAGVWTAGTTTMSLADYLVANGASLPAGTILKDCTAISSDGKTFAGYTDILSPGGIQGFVATIGVMCPADLDNDGNFSNGGTRDRAVTIEDLLYFLTGFESGNLAVDLDNGTGTGTHDHAVDINDLLYFLGHFEAGC